MTSAHALPPIPGTPFRALDYTAHTGLWEGGLQEVRWGYPKGWLRSQVRRALLRRRSFQVFVSTPELALVVTLRDEGTSGAAHVVAWHAGTGAVLGVAHAVGRPLSDLAVGPFAGQGTDAWLRCAGGELLISRPEGRSAWVVVARFEGLVVDLSVDTEGAPPPVTAIGEPKQRRPGLATRWNLLAARGTADIAGKSYAIDGLGSLAYTNVFRASGERWFEITGLGRLADGRRIGIGLTDGGRLGDVQEHVLFIDEEGSSPGLHLLPRARIVVGGKVARDTWRIRSPHGDCELKLRPLGADVEQVVRPLGGVRLERVVGTLSGRVPLPDGGQAIVDGVPALAEDHRPS